MLVLTQGLIVNERKSRRSGWCDVILKRLLLNYDQIATSETTAEAEVGLSVESNSYWFIARVVQLYGRTLMVWSLDPQLLPKAMVAPFDTGGLWFDHIAGDPPFVDNDDKSEFVAEFSQGAVSAEGSWRSWISDSFLNPSDYVAGVGPPQGVVANRILPSVEDPFSWSWEFRYVKSKIDEECLGLVAIFWTAEDYRLFRAFVAGSGMHDAEVRAVLILLAAVSVVSDDSYLSRQRARAEVCKEMLK